MLCHICSLLPKLKPRQKCLPPSYQALTDDLRRTARGSATGLWSGRTHQALWLCGHPGREVVGDFVIGPQYCKHSLDTHGCWFFVMFSGRFTQTHETIYMHLWVFNVRGMGFMCILMAAWYLTCCLLDLFETLETNCWTHPCVRAYINVYIIIICTYVRFCFPCVHSCTYTVIHEYACNIFMINSNWNDGLYMGNDPQNARTFEQFSGSWMIAGQPHHFDGFPIGDLTIFNQRSGDITWYEPPQKSRQ